MIFKRFRLNRDVGNLSQQEVGMLVERLAVLTEADLPLVAGLRSAAAEMPRDSLGTMAQVTWNRPWASVLTSKPRAVARRTPAKPGSFSS